MKSITTLLIAYLIFCIDTFASSDLNFWNINSIFGISMRRITSICEDEDGFIWGSSKMGIIRLTEGSYKTYRLPYKTTDVGSINLAYGSSGLYAYTNNGQLFRYDKIYDKFDLVKNLREYFEDKFFENYKVIVAENDCLWIACTQGLYTLRNDSLSLVTEPGSRVRNMLLLTNDSLIYTTDNNISLIELNSLKKEIIFSNNFSMDINMNIRALFHEKKLNRLWIGTFSGGLYYIDLKKKYCKKATIPGFSNQPILAIEAFTDSTLLVGFDGDGIWEVNKKRDIAENIYREDIDNPMSLLGNGVYDIMRDKNKRVWVATFSGGISFFDNNPSVFYHLAHQVSERNSLINNNVNSVLEDKNGLLWFATDNGISRWDRLNNKWDTFVKKHTVKPQVFLSLCEDNDGNIWAGTYSSGLYILDGKTGNQIFNTENVFSELTGKYIFDIYKDSQDDIWLGGIEGNVLCYLHEKKRFQVYSKYPVNSFTEFSPGKVLATCRYGLLLFDKASGTTDILLEGYIALDCAVINNEIWLATGGDGLLKFNLETREVKKFTTESGILSNYINSIIVSDKTLLLGTENGLCKFSLDDYSVRSYPATYSFSNVSYNTTARLRLKTGEIIWGTNKGAFLFNPEIFTVSKPVGKLFIQDLKISGRSIREIPELLTMPVNNLRSIRLKYSQRNIAIDLISIGISPALTKYSWKIEGIDSDWSDPSDLKTITYANLPSGRHMLEIRMLDNSLSKIIDEHSIFFRVTPPFWKSWWFIVTMTILFFVAIFSFFRIRINHLNQLHAKDKIRSFASMAHDIRTSLTLIKAPIEKLKYENNLSEDGVYYLNIAAKQSEKLASVTTQLLDFQKADIGKEQLFLSMVDIIALIKQRVLMFKAAAAENEIEVDFISNIDTYHTAIDELKIEKAVDNLLSNAIKYSFPNGKIEVFVKCDEKSWMFGVKDNGMGISKNAQNKLFKEYYRGDNKVNSRIVGSGIGLLLAKKYITIHEGEIWVKSEEGKGSLFTFEIPYRKISRSDNLIEKIDFSEDADSITIHGDADKMKHILIVEDNADLLEFIKKSFGQQYVIHSAGDGQEAWNIIKKNAPDLIISDIKMPVMDGFDLCHMVKSTFETSHIPVILLTSLTEKVNQLKGLGLGADDYITKPFDISLLEQRMNSIIKNREIIKDRALRLTGKDNCVDEPILNNELNDQFLKRALEVVQASISNSEFSKEDFAKEMCVSPSLLYKKLKALTGLSPVLFIRNLRMNHAMELLLTGKYTITEISEACGFSSITYFGIVFKKHFGKSATEIFSSNIKE